ncbi:hypothetical protein [Kitasatospora sp. NPDC088779]
MGFPGASPPPGGGVWAATDSRHWAAVTAVAGLIRLGELILDDLL